MSAHLGLVGGCIPCIPPLCVRAWQVFQLFYSFQQLLKYSEFMQYDELVAGIL